MQRAVVISAGSQGRLSRGRTDSCSVALTGRSLSMLRYIKLRGVINRRTLVSCFGPGRFRKAAECVGRAGFRGEERGVFLTYRTKARVITAPGSSERAERC